MGSNPTPGATKHNSPLVFLSVNHMEVVASAGLQFPTVNVEGQEQLITCKTILVSTSLSINPDERPVLLSLDGRGFYVLHYTAIPEQGFTRIRFDLADPNTGEGGSAEAVVDSRLIETMNAHNHGQDKGRALLIWIDTRNNEVRWQLRKFEKFQPDLS